MTTLPFPNPPITEAIFDIRVSLPKDTTIELLATFQDEIKDSFPTRKDRRKLQGGFQFHPNNPPKVLTPSDTVDGYLFHSKDGKKIVQARLDGFSFNMLKPYSNWESFSEEANTLWQHFINIANPINVTRLALRYINRIELPLPFNDFKEYVVTIPEVGPNIPVAVSDFFCKLVTTNVDKNITAIITENIDTKKQTLEKLPLIFDIDAFKQVNLKPTGSDVNDIMEELRNFKNDIFLNSLTDKTKELFK